MKLPAINQTVCNKLRQLLDLETEIQEALKEQQRGDLAWMFDEHNGATEAVRLMGLHLCKDCGDVQEDERCPYCIAQRTDSYGFVYGVDYDED